MSRSTPRPRVLLADDDDGILNAFERFLAPSCDVVGRVSDVGSLIDAAARLQPDVVLVDLFMPARSGLDACRRLRELIPRMRIIVVSADDDARARDAALRAGASAFVPKFEADDLLPAIHDGVVT